MHSSFFKGNFRMISFQKDLMKKFYNDSKVGNQSHIWIESWVKHLQYVQ